MGYILKPMRPLKEIIESQTIGSGTIELLADIRALLILDFLSKNGLLLNERKSLSHDILIKIVAERLEEVKKDSNTEN